MNHVDKKPKVESSEKELSANELNERDEHRPTWDGFIVFDEATDCKLVITITAKVNENIVPDSNGAVYLNLDPTYFLFEEKYVVDASTNGASVSKLAQLCEEEKIGGNYVLLHCPDGRYATALLATFLVLFRGMKDINKTKNKIKAAASQQTPLLNFNFSFLDDMMEYFNSPPWTDDGRKEISSWLAPSTDEYFRENMRHILPKSALVSSEQGDDDTITTPRQTDTNIPSWVLEWPEGKDYTEFLFPHMDAIDVAMNWTRNVGAATFLKNRFAVFEATTPSRMETPLYLAAKGDDINFVSFILQNGGIGTILQPNNDGKTPLFAAVYRGHVAVAKLLILFGGNIIGGGEFQSPIPSYVPRSHRRELKRWIEVLLPLAAASDASLEVLASAPETQLFRTHLEGTLGQIIAFEEEYEDDESSVDLLEARLAPLDNEWDRNRFRYNCTVQKAREELFRRNEPGLHNIVYML